LSLVELDHVKSGIPFSPEAGRNFIEQATVPSIARAEQLLGEKKIVAGGPVAGHIALRLVIEVGSLAELDQLMYSFPPYPLATTSVTPLIAFADRRASVRAEAERLSSSGEAR
jgi:hypothetical protein